MGRCEVQIPPDETPGLAFYAVAGTCRPCCLQTGNLCAGAAPPSVLSKQIVEQLRRETPVRRGESQLAGELFPPPRRKPHES